jgi:5-methylthioadenosine/S-adenosylhomocysteine deaminase
MDPKMSSQVHAFSSTTRRAFLGLGALTAAGTALTGCHSLPPTEITRQEAAIAAKHIDTLIVHGHLFTMRGPGVGYVPDGAVAIRGTRIVDVGPTAELSLRFQPDETIDARDCAVLPGLIDAHMHTHLAILRGIAQDIDHWMQRGLAPYWDHMTDEALMAGTRLNAVEALKAGTTTHGDYGGPRPGWGEFYVKLGVRACLTPVFNAIRHRGLSGPRLGDLYDFDTRVGRQSLDKAVAFSRDWNGAAEGRVTTMLGVHAPDMMPAEMLREAKRIGQREGWMLHTHLAQGARETEQILKRYGKRPVAFMEELGYLDEQLLAVHLTDATDEEARMVARSGARMVLCSGSIGLIDGLVPPAYDFKRAGGMVALGSDQAPGNNSSNIFNEMKLTALFNKIKYASPTVLPAWEALRMATIESAQAIGLGDRIGSLEARKEADIVLVDLRVPNLAPILLEPIRNIVPNLVYAGTGHEVKTVIVAGQTLMRDRRILTVDEAAIWAEAQAQAQAFDRRVTGDPRHRDLALVRAMDNGQL